MKRKKVSELAKQIRGVSYKTEDLHENLDENSVTLLRANNIFEGRINFDDVVYVDKSRVAREQYLCKGDILVCTSSGSKQLVGKAASFNFDTECTFGAFCKVVRPNQDVANYLSMYFQSNAYRRKISEVAIGANINNIRNEHIDALKLPIGSNAENEKVVASFSLLQQIIDGRKQQLHKLDELIKAQFVELFGDGNHPHIALIDLIIEGAGLSYGIVQPGDDGTGDMGVLRPVDMVDGKISTASIKYIDRSIGDGFKKTELYGDELLITVRGTTGITALTDIRFNGMNVTRGIAVVRYDRNKINPVYLNAYLNTDESQRYIQEHTRGATLQQINLSDLRVQQIMVPPLALQEQMAAFIEQTDKSKVVVQDEVNGL